MTGVAAEPRRGFEVGEYRSRTARAQAMLGELGLGALFVCTEPEVRYFTGFQTPFWLSPTRPWFVVVPVSGDPVAVIPSIGEELMRSSWIDDIRTWPSPRPHDDGVGLLAEAINDVTGGRGTLGVPMGPETHLRMPLADWGRLTEQIAPVRTADASAVVRGLRMVKSEAEVAKIGYACSIVNDAFTRIGQIVTVGMSEREAFRAFRIGLLDGGADDVPYLVGGTGTHLSDIISPPGDRTILQGDLLMFDTGTVWDGYWADFDRNFALGRADPASRRAYETAWQATEAALAILRPGVTTTELWRAMRDVLTAGGADPGGVGRLGHGLGMQLTEWPSHAAEDDTAVEERMVLTLEPSLEFEPGRVMVHEENVVVRADGPQQLSRRAPPELPVLG
ncbi:MAG: M24 family metallopeptidase [Acidimicrobiales bacterium]